MVGKEEGPPNEKHRIPMVTKLTLTHVLTT